MTKKNEELKLTKEEMELIVVRRRQEKKDIENADKVVKVGYLKQAEYDVDCFLIEIEDMLDKFRNGEILTESDKDKAIDKLQKAIPKMFKQVAPAGLKFECRMHYDGESWSDVNDDYCDMSASWAKKHLTGIKKVK